MEKNLMIKLDITVQPKSEKYLEFSQSLESIKPALEHCCTSLQIKESNKIFSIIILFDSVSQLRTAIHSKKFGIFSGAIKTLAERSDLTINGVEQKKERTLLKEIRRNFLKKAKKQSLNEI